MSNDVVFKDDGRKKIINGINKVCDAVGVTIGPSGRCVILSKDYGAPVITKDGVSVAKAIDLSDSIEKIGADLIKEVALKTNDVAGDGTSTACVLAQSFIENSNRVLSKDNNNFSEVKIGFDMATKNVISEIKKFSRAVNDVSDIKKVAVISANNDEEIGEVIAEAIQKVGKDGIISVEHANTAETSVKLVEGMDFDTGYLSPYFVTNFEKMIVEMEKPYILICDKKISVLQELLPILNVIATKGGSLLIISDSVDGDALSTLILNKMGGSLRVCAVKAPGFGDRKKEILQDIATVTGGNFISEDVFNSLESVTINDLGRAEKVKVTKDHTAIINGFGKKEDIESRVKQIRYQIENEKSEYDKEKLKERLAKISGGVAVIYVGAYTEVEMKEKKDRIDDALNATRAAIQEGVIPGGGVALLRCSKNLENLKYENELQKLGIDIVSRSLVMPIKKILLNAGVENYEEIIAEILESPDFDLGYNAKSRAFEKFFISGVIDPVKVTRTAIENAASISWLVIIADAIVYKKDDNKKQMPCVDSSMMNMN